MAKKKRDAVVASVSNLNVTDIWAPQQGPQLMATLCPVRMILFGGARGGGKTDCAIGKQIYGALRHGYDWNGLFIRKSFKYFAGIRTRLRQLIRLGLPAELVGPEVGTNYLRFHNGAIITLTVVESIEKAEFFQGQSFTMVSIEEACQFSYIDMMIEMLKGCLRSAAGVPTSMFLTANPGGPGHSQVKSRFMPKGSRPGQVMRDSSGMDMVFIPSRVEDNLILCENDPEYVNLLRSIKDPALRKAWLEGDWDVVLGGFFGDVWNPFKHVIPSFRPPAHWPRIVGMDWGSATPFSIGWYAVADGETSVPLPGGARIFRKGALIRFHEWYGCPKNPQTGKIEANVGLRLQSTDVGTRMVDMEARMPWLMGRTPSMDRIADPSVFAEKDGPSIAEKFADTGIVWRRAENRRISGWDTVRQLLHGVQVSAEWGEDENGDRILLSEEREPMLFFTDNCEHAIRTLPEQERDMTDFEDIDTAGEDHAVDEIRYVATSRPSLGILLKDLEKPAPLGECERDFLSAQAGSDNSAIMDDLSLPRTADMGYLAEEIGGLRVHQAR